MSDAQVNVPYGDKPGETATLLLAAAEDLDLDPVTAVRTSDGNFVVPESVAKEAGVKYGTDGADGPVEDKQIGDMNKGELQDEIDRRNEGRSDEDQIKPDGKNKPDLLAALQADDKAQADKDKE